MTKFPTVFTPHKRINCCVGSGVKTNYKVELQENGNFDLVPDGEIDLYGEIQSHALSCDINSIIARFSQGDESVLHRGSPKFGDFVGMPSTMAEVYQMAKDGEALFYSLPLEIREKFDNSIGQFFNSYGSKEFFDALGVEFEQDTVKPAAGDEKKEGVVNEKSASE